MTPRRIVKPFPSPADWRDEWIYFLMVDRFNNPAAPPRTAWDRRADDRQGGTFEGIREKLAYIDELGAGSLWLTPVLKNRQAPSGASHHGYGIMDFLEVDPRFGSTPDRAEAELIRLIDEAHARGLYVILDIVINHSGDIFAYDVDGDIWNSAPWSHTPYGIFWRDQTGSARRDWRGLPPAAGLPRHAGIWPSELQSNGWFRRQGEGGPLQGDFSVLKEFKTEFTDAYGDKPVWNLLIRAYQYVIARFDVDGFRIDTLKHVEREFALTFCNAIREFAFAIGKKNFFIFGETKSDDEEVLAAYTGRFTSEEEEKVGADASLDFPLQWKLGPAVKGFSPPTAVEDVFALRKRVHQDKHLLSTHGEASRFFVTFLDNHDDHSRFLYPRGGGDFSDQVSLALGCLFSLQGIPCLYYGTEQGLEGTQEIYAPDYDPARDGKPEHVREALWGKPRAFDPAHPLYAQVRRIASLRAAEPALRYGRQYFRQVSGNGADFGSSRDPGGIIAFSRILNDRELLVAANTSVQSEFSGWVVIDARINSDSTPFAVAYSNRGTTGSGTPSSGPATFYDRNNNPSSGWARRLYVKLAPMEVQILTPE
ncbi:MAG: alpha-amylase [Planctomycetes bacterium]|nr:alpha-amylase [Planctomycetota bacterium]